MDMKRFNNILEINIFRNSSQIFLGVQSGAFLGFGCPKRLPNGVKCEKKNEPLLESGASAVNQKRPVVPSLTEEP